MCLEARDQAREVVCTFPVNNVQQLMTMLQTRGEANAYDLIAQLPYNTYNQLVEQAQENERTSTRS